MTKEWNDKLKLRQAELKNVFQASNGKVSEKIKQELLELYELENADDLRRFGNGLNWLCEVIYKYDPIDLVPTNIPKNEYDCEARLILRELSLRGNPNFKEIWQVVHDIFALQFGIDSTGQIDRTCYEEISRALAENKNYWFEK